ncbi:MAG TPA: hypothetical protein VFM08_13835 [Nocardioides sp.]|jgi:hypothetical protein|nr:hypothetical protein [Nocardioides sp.]
MTRGKRTAWVFGVAGLLMVAGGVAGAQMLRADAQHPAEKGRLTQAQYDDAVRIARHQVRRLDPRLTSASAIVRPGTVTRPNMTGTCSSGSVILIRLAGHDFHVGTGARADGKDAPVTTVEITADATSGRPCLRSVLTGPPASPYRNGDDLLPALAR